MRPSIGKDQQGQPAAPHGAENFAGIAEGTKGTIGKPGGSGTPR